MTSFSSKMNSLVDSVLSLTIGDQIKNERKALNASKLNALHKFTVSNRLVNLIKPSRPDRKGLNSEIIIEKKLANGRSKMLIIRISRRFPTFVLFFIHFF